MQRKTVRVGIMSYEDYKKRTIAIAKGEYFLSSLPHEHVATAHKIPKVPISHAGFTVFGQLFASFSHGSIGFR